MLRCKFRDWHVLNEIDVKREGRRGRGESVFDILCTLKADPIRRYA